MGVGRENGNKVTYIAEIRVESFNKKNLREREDATMITYISMNCRRVKQLTRKKNEIYLVFNRNQREINTHTLRHTIAITNDRRTKKQKSIPITTPPPQQNLYHFFQFFYSSTKRLLFIRILRYYIVIRSEQKAGRRREK